MGIEPTKVLVNLVANIQRKEIHHYAVKIKRYTVAKGGIEPPDELKGFLEIYSSPFFALWMGFFKSTHPPTRWMLRICSCTYALTSRMSDQLYKLYKGGLTKMCKPSGGGGSRTHKHCCAGIKILYGYQFHHSARRLGSLLDN